MVRLAFLVAVGGALTACVIPSRSILPNERLPTTNDEAYVAFVVDVPERATLSIALCQEGDVGRCVTIGPQSADDGIRVAALPPARWCLQQFLLQDGATSLDVLVERARLRCFDVAPGAVTYPGHFSLLV